MLAFRYELFVDDLPVWGFVGPPPEESKESQGHIWTHKSFDIDYNDNRVRADIRPSSKLSVMHSWLVLNCQHNTNLIASIALCGEPNAEWGHKPAETFLLQIIQVNLTSENPQKIESGGKLDFTFSVRWTPSTIPFARRFERYLDYTFFEHQVPR